MKKSTNRTSEVTLSVQDVSFSYGRQRVLSNVSWILRAGVTGLLGPNGAGKTTLLNLLVGITSPSSGVISVTGTDGQGQSVREANIGFVPQRFSVAGELRVSDTIAYVAWINGVPTRDCARQAHEALEVVDLIDQASVRVRKLSGGQRQRLGIAAALSYRPDVLVLDEPTVGLDPGQRVRARGIIKKVGEQIPVLLSTHLIEDVSHLCTRVGVLVDGRLVFDGAQDELEKLMDDSNDNDNLGLGSRFERSYQSLIEGMAASND